MQWKLKLKPNTDHSNLNLLWKISSMETSEEFKSRRLSDIQNQLFKSWILSFRDNVTGHTLVFE